MVPFREQKQKMEEGKSYVVYVYLDKISERICASAKLDKYLEGSAEEFVAGQEVELLICNLTDLGYNAIIDLKYKGVIYKNEVFQTLNRGEKIKGYIKKVRDDGKIDLCLQKQGYENAKDFSDIIVDKLKEESGFIPVTDKSTPETIYSLFGMSKKNYKKAVGSLYKKRIISIEEKGIRLSEEKKI